MVAARLPAPRRTSGCDLQAAIDAPEFHTDHFPSSFFPRRGAAGSLAVESRLGDDAIAELRRRGHDVAVEGAVVARPRHARSRATRDS